MHSWFKFTFFPQGSRDLRPGKRVWSKPCFGLALKRDFSGGIWVWMPAFNPSHLSDFYSQDTWDETELNPNVFMNWSSHFLFSDYGLAPYTNVGPIHHRIARILLAANTSSYVLIPTPSDMELIALELEYTEETNEAHNG